LAYAPFLWRVNFHKENLGVYLSAAVLDSDNKIGATCSFNPPKYGARINVLASKSTQPPLAPLVNHQLNSSPACTCNAGYNRWFSGCEPMQLHPQEEAQSIENRKKKGAEAPRN